MDLLFVDPGSNVCDLKGVVEVCCVLCQLSVFILNIPNFSEWELIIIFFLVMLNTFFFMGGPKPKREGGPRCCRTICVDRQSSRGAHYRAFLMETQSLDLHWKVGCT